MNKRNTYFLFFLIAVLGINTSYLFAAEPIIIDNAVNRYPMGKHVEYYLDTDKKLTIDDMTGDKIIWQDLMQDGKGFGHNLWAYWFRFTVKNPGKEKIEWIFELAFPLIDRLDLYIPMKNGHYNVKSAGNYLPFHNRELIDRNLLFRMNEMPGEKTYYMRIESLSLIFKPIVLTKKGYTKRMTNEYAVIFLFFGAMIIMCIYNFILYLMIKEKSYIYLVLFIGMAIFSQSALHGLAFQYLWPTSIQWVNKSVSVFAILSVISACFFIRIFINAKEKFIRANLFLIVGLIIPGFVISSVILIFDFHPIIINTAKVYVAFSSLSLLTMFIILKKHPEIRILLISYIVVITAVIIYLLQAGGFIQTNFITIWSPVIGTITMIALFSIALANKINIMKDSLYDLNMNLENKVTERTRKLSMANNALVRSEMRIRSILDNSPDVMCNINKDMIVQYLNRMPDDSNVENVLGISILDVIPKKFQSFFRNAFSQVFNGNEADLLKIEIKNIEGHSVWLENRFAPIRHDDIVDEVMIIITDFTKRKQAEMALAAAQKDLIQEAHKAGMADIATDTLHNIGNVLNSVKTSSQMISDSLEQSGISGLKRANDLLKKNMENLEEFITTNPKGKKLMEYYLKLEEIISDDYKTIKNHQVRLNEKVEIITNILVAQQSYAGADSLSEKTELHEIVDDALTMQSEMLNKQSIKIIKYFNTNKKVLIQKNKLMNILINLIKNAVEAMEKIDNEKKLSISIDQDEKNIYVRVRDSGRGIAPENLKQIFAHGFTTTKNNLGFGLHTCANYMTEMNGKISVESYGIGKGATFILEFPL